MIDTTPAAELKRTDLLNQAATLAKDAMFGAVEAGVMPVKNKCADVIRLLMQAGADSPFAGGKASPGIDLATLATLDTPDTRELLGLLERAQVVAERVDAQRGRSLDADVPLLPGESRGTDLAESISELALRLRLEVGGTKGRD